MKGKIELRVLIENLINDRYNNPTIEDVENGFQFRILDYPYTFKVLCYDQIGWNVYLEMNGENVLIEHPETNKLYEEMENIVDEVNYQFYELDENIKPIVDKSFEQLDEKLEVYSDHIASIDKEGLKYNIRFNQIEDQNPEVMIKYSISMNNWHMETENIFKGSNIIDGMFDIFNELSILVQTFNKNINNLNYYF